MNLSTSARQKVLWVAAAAGPIVAVQAARFALGGGPAAASAAQVQANPDPSPAAAKPAEPLTDAQRRALAWIDEGNWKNALSRSPMHAPDAARPSPIVEVDGTPRIVVPTLRLGGIVSRGSEAIASINNRLFTVGDEPAHGWRIERIDQAARLVLFRGPDGRAVELSGSGVRELTDDADRP